jgi:LuxR family maltose regulon positive regulatory protein
MATPILATKLYIPPPQPIVVTRPRLFQQLDEGLQRKLTLISAPAGFGKTTLISEWVAGREQPIAWLSLDEGDNDPVRFLTYLVAALQALELSEAKGIATPRSPAGKIGEGVLGTLQAPQPPPIEPILTVLLNEITNIPGDMILVLDDYHAIDAKPVVNALDFLLRHQPPQMHLVIATREDPQLPLARLRARGQLTELRAADLRFTFSETTGFLNQIMGLNLSEEDIAALETRTEGWIAGLQLAALALQGLAAQETNFSRRNQDAIQFIQSFTGSHHYVMDYLVEEVLGQQPERVQTFLLRTSILDRLCAPLCDEVVGPLEGWNVNALSPHDWEEPSHSSNQRSNFLMFKRSNEILEYLEHANLFIFPLDNERRWYRYHHLFADLLRQRLHQSFASSEGDAETRLHELHIRASQWYEHNGFGFEAFQHAAAADDTERAERLIGGEQIPQYLRGAVTAILDWLGSLPEAALDARPWLWWRYASLLLINGQRTGVEEKLQRAEASLATSASLQGATPDERTQSLIGLIASARAVLALTQYQAETMFTQSRRALAYLPTDNLISRASANWVLGNAHLFQGERAAAHQAFTESITLSQESGDIFTTILATIGLGNVQEAENQLYQAAETYQRVVQMAGDQPIQIVYEAHLGLARIFYEWNDLDAAEQQGRRSLLLARQYDRVIDRFIVCEVFLARLKLAQGDVAEAAAILAQADQSARRQNFVYRIPEIAAAQVLTLLRQGHLAAATQLTQNLSLPLTQARVFLAKGNASAALAVLEPWRQQVEAKFWRDERLKVTVLQAIALREHSEQDEALRLLGEALALAEPGGFIRIFVDEGLPMEQLLSDAAAQGFMPSYTGKLQAVFESEKQKIKDKSPLTSTQPLIKPETRPAKSMLVEPLSQRELEVLQLIAQGLSNREIGEQLFIALNTVKGHNRNIFEKLQVQRRTEAVRRARELGLLS